MSIKKPPKVIVIGAGIGGLTTAALLLKSGMDVTVLEAQVYPGGSAGTFFHRNYRFDAGATLAGGFSAGGPHQRVFATLGIDLPVYHSDPAWIVHLPDAKISQWNSREEWDAERLQVFPNSETFWQKQEQLAEIAWRLTQQHFPYPPQNFAELAAIAKQIKPYLLPAVPYLFRSVKHLSPKPMSALLRTFLDAQLLISAQTTSEHANALYGSAALDLPRRGIVLPQGGMGAISTSLVDWIRQNGGQVLFRQHVTVLEPLKQGWLVTTAKDQQFHADRIVANLTPSALKTIRTTPLIGLKNNPNLQGRESWGAFVLYLGVDRQALREITALHHQVVVNPSQPLGEGNSLFISLSHPQDTIRAPQNHLAVTISTHTQVDPWWQWHEHEPQKYQDKKSEYTEKILNGAEIALTGLRNAIRIQMAGTPLTYESFTSRPRGYVGGYPQTSLLNVRSSSSGLRNVWLVGDSIFPGQSTAAVTIGAIQVAAQVLKTLGK